ncbi:MAG: hypothetical protein NVS3B20_25230 [Polyangiales bacterium]
MTPAVRASALLFAALLANALLACSGVLGDKNPHAPGDSVGRYRISAEVDATSSCAEAVAAAPRPWTFEVTLRRDGKTAFWIASDTPIVGTLDDKGALAFHATASVAVHGVDKVHEVGACTIVRTDDFGGAFLGSPATKDGISAFNGTLRYGYQVAPGSDCSDVVGQPSPDRKQPMFSTMPCEVRFHVSAQREGDAKPPR